MSGFVVDLSWAWPTATGAVLRGIGATGVIAYAGCDDTSKNVSPARFADWVESGLQVGLVIENGATDLRGGQKVGAYEGQRIAAAARQLGYDVDHCVLFAAADWNSQGADLDQIDLAMQAFAAEVPVPGLYGNSYALDRCTQSGHALYRWQSNSASFSNGPSPHAHLLQRYADPRARGLAVDVNDIQNTPLGLMGENTMANLDADDKAWLTQTVHDQVLGVLRGDEIQQDLKRAAMAALDSQGVTAAATVITAKDGVSDRVAHLETVLTQQGQALAQLPTQLVAQVTAALPAGTDTAAIEEAVKAALGAVKLTGSITGGLA